MVANFHERHQRIEWIGRRGENKNTNRLKQHETIKILTRKIKLTLIAGA